MSEPCVYCNKDTSFGSGRFINRIPSDGDGTRDGYACAECMQMDCDRCEKKIPLDEDITPNDTGWKSDDGHFYDGANRVHEECLTHEEKQLWEEHVNNG